MRPWLKQSMWLAALIAASALCGCSKSQTAAVATGPTTPVAPQGVPGSAKQQRGGGVIDEKEYPAPTGVKTGIQPGGAANK